MSRFAGARLSCSATVPEPPRGVEPLRAGSKPAALPAELRRQVGMRCGWRGSNPHGLRPPASEAGAYPCSATSAQHLKDDEPQAHAAERAARRSRGRPRPPRSTSCRFEARLAADLELHDLGRARRRLGACRDPNEVEMHLRLLSVSKGARGALPVEGTAGEVGDELRARDDRDAAGPPGLEPGPTRLELVMLPLHHGPVKRTTRIERASPEWRPGALPSELRPRNWVRRSAELRAHEGASGRSRTRTSAVQRARACR